jgi:hypothetical protein
MRSAIDTSPASFLNSVASRSAAAAPKTSSAQSWKEFEQYLSSAIQTALVDSGLSQDAVKVTGNVRQDSDASSVSGPIALTVTIDPTKVQAATTAATSEPTAADATPAQARANPFAIPFPYESKQAAELVAHYLGGTVVGNHVGMDMTPLGQLPVDIWSVNVGGRTYEARFLAKSLNESSPDRLRVDLNEIGISALGAAPLPSKVAYQSNYDRDPSAREPGALPSWATLS